MLRYIYLFGGIADDVNCYVFFYDMFASSIFQAKSETLQKQLNSMLFSKKQKLQKMNDDTTSDGVLVTPSQDSPGTQFMMS